MFVKKDRDQGWTQLRIADCWKLRGFWGKKLRIADCGAIGFFRNFNPQLVIWQLKNLWFFGYFSKNSPKFLKENGEIPSENCNFLTKNSQNIPPPALNVGSSTFFPSHWWGKSCCNDARHRRLIAEVEVNDYLRDGKLKPKTDPYVTGSWIPKNGHCLPNWSENFTRRQQQAPKVRGSFQRLVLSVMILGRVLRQKLLLSYFFLTTICC